jgi:hypothetical protein
LNLLNGIKGDMQNGPLPYCHALPFTDLHESAYFLGNVALFLVYTFTGLRYTPSKLGTFQPGIGKKLFQPADGRISYVNIRAQRSRDLCSAAWPIASLHASLREAKRRLTHRKIRPEPGLIVGHCSCISGPQASTTGAILTSAALHGSVKSRKCASMHSLSRPPDWAAGLQKC